MGDNLEDASDAAVAVGNPNVVHQVVSANFINTLRYMGGADAPLDDAFINTDVVAGNSLFTIAPNPNATFASFTYEGYDARERLGGSNRGTIDLLREFITVYYPNMATVLRNLDNAGGPMQVAAADAIGSFCVRGVLVNDNVFGASTLGEMQTARDELHSCTHSSTNVVDNGSISFGACPHIAIKFGYYIQEICSTLYFKAGAALLSGKATFAVGGQKGFDVITPMVAVEFNRPIGDKLNFGIELSHSFGTSKKFAPQQILGMQIKPEVKISRTTLRAIILYNFS